MFQTLTGEKTLLILWGGFPGFSNLCYVLYEWSSIAVSGTVVTVSGTLNDELPLESTELDLFEPFEGISCIQISITEEELNLLDLWLGLSLTNESGTVLALEREFRLERMLLDSLTKELGTTILGFKLLDLLDDVSLTKESWTIKLVLELPDLLDGVLLTKESWTIKLV